MGGIWHGKVARMGGLTQNTVIEHLKDIFNTQIKTGFLDTQELSQMAAVAFKKLDVDSSGVLECGDFVKSCIADEILNLETVARVLNNNEKKGKVRILRR